MLNLLVVDLPDIDLLDVNIADSDLLVVDLPLDTDSTVVDISNKPDLVLQNDTGASVDRKKKQVLRKRRTPRSMTQGTFLAPRAPYRRQNPQKIKIGPNKKIYL